TRWAISRLSENCPRFSLLPPPRLRGRSQLRRRIVEQRIERTPELFALPLLEPGTRLGNPSQRETALGPAFSLRMTRSRASSQNGGAVEQEGRAVRFGRRGGCDQAWSQTGRLGDGPLEVTTR